MTRTGFISFAHDTRGAAVIDFAFALPVLVTLMLGTFQLSNTLHASGAMRHAVGEGIRLAKVDPTASISDIEAAVKNNFPAMDTSKITKLQVNRGISNGARTGTITMEYKVEPIVPILPIPDVKLTETKQVYLPA